MDGETYQVDAECFRGGPDTRILGEGRRMGSDISEGRLSPFQMGTATVSGSAEGRWGGTGATLTPPWIRLY